MSIIINAANEPTFVEPSVIQSCIAAVDRQLYENHLHTSDVIGNGNCFYRAISVSLHGNQSKHTEIRQYVAKHVL